MSNKTDAYQGFDPTQVQGNGCCGERVYDFQTGMWVIRTRPLTDKEKLAQAETAKKEADKAKADAEQARDTAVAEKDQAEQAKTQAENERDAALNEKANAEQERDTAIADKAQMAQDKAQAEQERDTAIRERDEALAKLAECEQMKTVCTIEPVHSIGDKKLFDANECGEKAESLGGNTIGVNPRG